MGPAAQGVVELRSDGGHRYSCATPGGQGFDAILDPLHRPPRQLYVWVAFATVAATSYVEAENEGVEGCLASIHHPRLGLIQA